MSRGLVLHQVSVARLGRHVVAEVDLEVAPGEICGLLGPNGAGKSSLLEAVVGALEFSGHASVGGVSLAGLVGRERARRVSLVGREAGDDSLLSVRDVVELGRAAHLRPFQPLSLEDQAAVAQALQRTGCGELAERPLFALSDGERQRVHFARALAQNPELLLLDEATRHLDLAHREEALGWTRQFVQAGGAALVALHDLDLAARHCNTLALLERGRLVAYGPPELVLTEANLARVFAVRACYRRDEYGPCLRIFGGRAELGP